MRAAHRFLSTLSFALIFSALSGSSLLAQQSSVSPLRASSPRNLITQPVKETQLTVLRGNTHPLARPEFDLGSAPATLPMQRMLLVLKRSPQQELALRTLLDNQQDKASPSYHKWLTPQQFGQQFGPTNADLQIITTWLQSHGFQLGAPSKGRTVLEFSGSASQVQEAFHTPIHKYIVNGEQHWANSTDPQIPTALTPAVAGILTLHNFLKKPLLHLSTTPVPAKLRPGKRPEVTLQDGTYALAPADYATIYNINPVYNTPNNNTGQTATIAIVARNDLYNGGSDVENFRSNFLPSYSISDFQIIPNGPDPGDVGGGEEAEATLDTTWAGAVAPGAAIDFVVSASTNTTDGVDLSETYIVENNLADIMTESFGSCEVEATDQAGVVALAEQAAAQGITYMVSTGDSGAEGCDDPNSETVATGPISVNVLASTNFNVAVGGTLFNENGDNALYWSTTNTNNESALSYIPEDVWNESCTAATCTGTNTPGIWAGGGGVSIFSTAKPVWQTGVTGIPQDNARDLPDVALSAASHDGYLLCLEGSCVPNSQGEFNVYLISGTSASSPSFAGIMGLVVQQMATVNPGQSPRQGQANYILYRLATLPNASAPCNASSTTGLPGTSCIFNDVTVGNNAVPGEVNYSSATADYQATVGYDLTTGLGSVNVANLVSQWNSVTFNPTTTTLGLTPVINITHGSPVNVTATVAPSSGTGTPTGDVSLIAATGPSLSAQTAFQFFTLSAGSIAQSTNLLPGGGPYNVTAQYGGDATYAPSVSAPVQVTVGPEPSTTTLSGPFTQDQNGLYTIQFSTPQPFGTPVFIRADVVGNSGIGSPTGTVTFTSSSGTIPNGASQLLNNQGNTSIQSNPFLVNGPVAPFDAGQYSISATYAGDASFLASSATPPITFTIQPGFFANVPANVSSVLVSAPGASGTSSVSISSSTGFSGTITLACSGLPAGATCAFSPASITATGTPTTTTATIVVTTTAATTAQLQPPSLPNSPSSPLPFYLAHWMSSFPLLFSGLLISGVLLVGTTLFGLQSMPQRTSASSPLGNPDSSQPGNSDSSRLGKGTTFSRAINAFKMNPRFSARGKLSPASRLFLQTATIGSKSLIPAFSLAALLLLLLALPACGGGSSHTTPPVVTPPTPTPAGTYNVTVTATSGSLTSSNGFTLFVE